MASGRVPKTIITLERIVIPFRFVSATDLMLGTGFNQSYSSSSFHSSIRLRKTKPAPPMSDQR